MPEAKEGYELLKDYSSPRWSGEILDCAIPMTLDTYDHCSYNCSYCFSYFQKSLKQYNPLMPNQTKNYMAMPIRSVDPEKVKKIFTLESKSQFEGFIKNKITLQWGGLSDPFDNYEKRFGITLELMKFFKDINYPLRFSSKGTWWVHDKRYRDLIKGQKNWSFMSSIINLNEETSRLVERGTDSPMKRMEALEEWVGLGAGDAILRLRPFTIGVTDANDEYKQMIEMAGAIGCKAISTEFFCLEMRGDGSTHKRYDIMSKAIGFDIVDFYKKNSPGQTGYLRLNWNIKEPFVNEMDRLCKKWKMRLAVSDAHHKDKGATGACCGLDTKVMKHNPGQFTEALVTAKKRHEDTGTGEVGWQDLAPALEKLGFKEFLWRQATNFNTGSSETRAKRYNQTMFDYFREIWNTPNDLKSPYKYFQGLLKPVRVDENNDVIYRYDPYSAE